MTEVDKDKDKISGAAELMRKGATLLGEVCPRCGSLQVRYKGRTLCLSCDDLSDLDAVEITKPAEGMPEDLRGLILSKIQKISDALRTEEDIERQAKMADLILLYIEIIERIK